MFSTIDPGEGKHHLRLSETAYLCIESDRQSFSQTESPIPFAGFINRVFLLYHARAEASFARRSNDLLRQRRELRQQLTAQPDFTGCAELLERYDKAAVHQQIQQQAKALLAQFSRSGGKSRKVRLNKQNMDYLYGPDSDCQEEIYYKGSAGLYLRAVLEEYCRLSYSERERIYFPVPSITPGQTLLSLTTAAGSQCLLYPLATLNQALSPYNYLLGAELHMDACGNIGWAPFSIRLTRISSCREVSVPRGVGCPDSETRQLCFSSAHCSGLSYLTQPCQLIRVRLTKPHGVELYRRILWYRPPIESVIEETKHTVTYQFHCPLNQAQNYFIRFGAAACILSPDELRQKINLFHSEAAAQYNQNT